MIEIEKNKNGKCLVISVFILPDDDELIKRPFAYWHTRVARDRIFANFLRDWRTSNFETFSIENGCLDRFENSRISSTQIGQLQVSRQ